MNKRIKEIAKQAGLKFSKDWGECHTGNVQIERFAELVRQDEREACAEIARFARMHAIADAIMKRGRNMSTKPENIDTSEERVHETDKSVHEDDDIQEYKRPWVGLTDEEVIEWVESGEYNVITNDWASHIEFARAIEAKLKEKNT